MFKFNFNLNHRCLHANTLALFVQVQQTRYTCSPRYYLWSSVLLLWRDTCYLLTVYQRVNSVPI